MSTRYERLRAGIGESGEIHSYIKKNGKVRYADTVPRVELARYHKGYDAELGKKALQLLDVITAPDVDSLEIETWEGVILQGKVSFKDSIQA